MTSKKPIKLEWQGNIASTTPEDAVAVPLKGSPQPPKEKGEARSITGNVKVRRETKHRAGHTVHVLFDFTDGAAKNPGSLTDLCKKVKEKMGCGGAVEDNRIIVQSSDAERIAKVLVSLGLTPKIC